MRRDGRSGIRTREARTQLLDRCCLFLLSDLFILLLVRCGLETLPR